MAALAKYAVGGFPDSYKSDGSDNWQKWIDQHTKALDKLIEKSTNLPDSEVVGGVLSFVVGDGKAFYIVTKERPLTVAWVPFLDCHQVDPMLIRGMRLADVRRLLKQSKSLSKMFKGRA